MARKIGFHIYLVRVRERYERDCQVLSSIDGEFDLHSMLLKGLKGEIERHKKDEASERIACMKRISSDGRALTGLFNAGHYGESADIVDTISATISYEKKTTEAEMVPCFFRLDIPEDKDEALLILQRDNRVSCKGAFVSLISPILFKVNDSLKLDVTPLTSKEVFQKLVADGEVQRLRFIRMGITDDFADSYDKGHKEVEGTMELSIRARRGYSLPFRNMLSNWLNTKESVKDIYAIPALDFDSVKADVRIGKTVRTLDFGKKFSTPIVDLTSSVKIGSNGHPTYASLNEATAQLAKDQLSEMYD